MRGGALDLRGLDKFKTKMSLSGSSIREESRRNSRMLMEQTFEDDASFHTDIYFWELNRHDYSDCDAIPIRLFKRTFSAAQGYTVKFQTPYSCEVCVGDIIYDSSKNEHFICTEAFDHDGIHWRGRFTYCNWILRWQDQYGRVLDYPCYDMNTTQYNSGEQSNFQFTIGSTQHMITLPADENTVCLRSPQRFFLDKDKVNSTSFMVTQNDNTSYNYGKKGLVRLTVYECESDARVDRYDLGICDYKEPPRVEYEDTGVPEKRPHISVEILRDQDFVTSGGDKAVFTARFTDEDDNVRDDITAYWTIVCDFKDELDVDDNDSSIAIGIDNDDYIDEEFKVVLKGYDLEDDDSVIVRVESLL